MSHHVDVALGTGMVGQKVRVVIPPKYFPLVRELVSAPKKRIARVTYADAADIDPEASLLKCHLVVAVDLEHRKILILRSSVEDTGYLPLDRGILYIAVLRLRRQL